MMEACGLRGRGAQAKMMALTGWSRATMSQLYNGKQDFSPEILRTAAEALQVEPYELLMLPEKAMLLRQAVASARRIVQLAGEPDASNVAAFPVKFAKGE